MAFFQQCKFEQYLSYQKEHKDFTWDEVITYVNIGLNREFYGKVEQISHPSTYYVLVNKFNQLPEDYEPEDLEEIKPCFNSGSLLLRREARVHYEKMSEEALSKGIYLKAISTYRSCSYQNHVYYKNYTPDIPITDYQYKRDKVSARAGHSEHQTGLAVDINDLEQSFEHTAEAGWLAGNAYQYGFIQRYPKGKERITGYNYEPWHYRYLGVELALKVYHSNLTYDEYYIRYFDEVF